MSKKRGVPLIPLTVKHPVCSGRDKRCYIKRVTRHDLQGKCWLAFYFSQEEYGLNTAQALPVFRGRVQNLYARRHIAAADAKFV